MDLDLQALKGDVVQQNVTEGPTPPDNAGDSITTVSGPVPSESANASASEATAPDGVFLGEQPLSESQEELVRIQPNTLKNYRQAQEHYYGFIARSSQYQGQGQPQHVDEARVYEWIKFALTEPKRNLKAGSYNIPPPDSDDLPTLKSDGSPASRKPITVRNWISGIVALWVEQRESGCNTSTHPAPSKHATMRAIEAYESKYTAVLAKSLSERGERSGSEEPGPSHQQQHGSNAGPAALAQIAPDISQALDALQSTVTVQLEGLETAVCKLGSSASLTFNKMELKLEAMHNELTAFRQEASLRESFVLGTAKITAMLTTAIAALEDGDSQAWHGVKDQVGSILEALNAQSTMCSALHQRASPTHAVSTLLTTSASTATIAPPLPAGTCPPYRMSKDVKSVIELVEEWWVPHGAYMTCVAQLEEEWGPRWREDQPNPTTGKRRNAKSKYFGDRLVIIDEVERRAEAKAESQNREVTLTDRQSVAKEMDDERQGLSLYALQEKLKGQRPPKRRRTVPDDQQTPTST